MNKVVTVFVNDTPALQLVTGCDSPKLQGAVTKSYDGKHTIKLVIESL